MANTTLTKEYFDKVIGGFSKSVDKRFKEQNKDLKTHVTKEIGELARMTANGFHGNDEDHKKMHQKLDLLVEGHKNHEKRIKRVENAVGIPESV